MSEVYRSEGNLLAKTINKKISRRSFLKWSAAIGATTSVAGLISQKNKKAEAVFGQSSPISAEQLNWMPTTCLVCHGWDGKAIGIDGNKCVRKIEGMGGQKSGSITCDAVYGAGTNTSYDPDLRAYQSAQVAGSLRYYPGTRGKICAKGSNGMEHMYDPDRVKFPLVRVGARGAGNWRRTSWKEATRLAARAIMNARGTKVIGGVFAGANEWVNVDSPTTTGSNLRHASNVFYWRGRDETGEHGWTGRFANSIGCGSVAHTSLCEVSRHAAYATMYDHHFPMPDANNHNDPNDDCDIMVEFGGNGVEQKIPAYMTAQRWGDRRGRGCRIISADPRQSNSSAYADEWIQMRPGTDGALALAICHTIMTADGTVVGGGHGGGSETTPTNYGSSTGAWGWEASGFQGGTYADIAAGGAHTVYAAGTLGYLTWSQATTIGLYPYDEEFTVTDAAANSTSTKIPRAESLLSYVRNLDGDTLEGGATRRNKTWGATITGLSEATIVYLAKLFGHQAVAYENPTTGATETKTYRHPQWNCYRGPCKHTNGTYATKAGECLNILSGATHSIACGNSRHNWPEDTPHVNIHLNGGAAGDSGSNGEGVPRWDLWDFVNGRSAYVQNYAGVDQNTVPSLRVGCGLDTGVAPSYAYSNTAARASTASRLETYTNLAPKCVILFKNAPTQTRGDKELDVQLFTAQWAGTGTDWIPGGLDEYKVKYLISIDLNMGDGTRLVDVILPDGSYLERNDLGIVHTHAFAAFNLIRQPVLRASYPPVYSNHDIITLHRVHQIQAITRAVGMAIDVEYACKFSQAVGGDYSYGTKSVSPGSYFKWGTHTSIPATLLGAADLGTDPANLTSSPDNAGDVAMMREHDDAMDNYWLRIWGGSHTPTQVTGSFASYNSVGGPSEAANGRGNSTTNSAAGVQYIEGNTAEDKYNWLMRNGSYWYTPSSWSGGNWNQWIRGGMYGGKRGNWPLKSITGGGHTDSRNKFMNVYSHLHGDFSWSAGAATKFYGGPRYVPIETPKGTYSLGATAQAYNLQHTTMKRNVHTQSRTASLPRLMEILGSNPMWMNPTDASALTLSDGSLVKVYLPRLKRGTNLSDGNSRNGGGGPMTYAAADGSGTTAGSSVPTFEWESTENYYIIKVHVTPRIMAGVVATSAHFGHSTDREGALDTTNGQAFGSHTIDSANNRLSTTTNTNPQAACSLTSRPASAPGAGWNPNWGFHRLTDPLGCSHAFFDNVCRIVKL